MASSGVEVADEAVGGPGAGPMGGLSATVGSAGIALLTASYNKTCSELDMQKFRRNYLDLSSKAEQCFTSGWGNLKTDGG